MEGQMTHLTYCRIFGYVTTILVHVINILYMNSFLQGEVMDDPVINTYANMQARFFTCWTFFLQIVFAIVALASDCLLLNNSHNKSYKLPKHLRGARDTLFEGIVWPSTWLVFTFFWAIFLYDRDLILPSFIDKVLTRTSNHIIHTFIVPVVLWEVMFRPRPEPGSHWRNLGYVTFHMALYLTVLIFTYYERNFWVYPIMGQLYGTVYFPILMAFILAKMYFFYYLQWWIRRVRWGKVELAKNSEKPKKIR